MSRTTLRAARQCLLIGLFLGGSGLLTSSASSPAKTSQPARPGTAQLVRDVCALVEPVDAPSPAAATAIPPEWKWRHRKLGIGQYAAIATSAAGVPHVVFTAYPKATHVKHMWLVGTTWHSETIASAPYPATLAQMPALTIGSNGALHVAFTAFDYVSGSGSGALYYARNDGSGWQVETVEPGGLGSMSIAVDDAGVPHILHLVAQPSNEVRYLTRGPGGWTGETIASSEYSNYGSALQLHDAKPYAVFMSGSNILLAIGEPGGWTVEPIASGSGCTLAFDDKGVLHVAYVQWVGGQNVLVHASLTESGWTSETLVDESTLFGEAAPTNLTFLPEWPALTADTSGRIRLAFGLNVFKGNQYGKALAVAFLEDGAWLPLLPGKSLTGGSNTITVDAGGIPHVATVKYSLVDAGKSSVHEYRLRGSKLSLAVAPKDSGTIDVEPVGVEATGNTSVSVFPGNTVTLTATAADGFEFAGWSGTLSGTDPVVELTMEHAIKAVAHFEPTEP